VQLTPLPTIQWPHSETFLGTEYLIVICGLIIHPILCQVTIICGQAGKQMHSPHTTGEEKLKEIMKNAVSAISRK